MGKTNWDDAGLPVLTDAEGAGMRDFWEVYEENYDLIYEELMREVGQMPQFGAILKSMPKEQLERQSREARARGRAALLEGAWKPLLDDQRTQGATYAAAGVRFREWFDLVSGFNRLIVPALVKKHGADAARLSRALLGLQRYLDVAMSVLGEAYLDTKEALIQKQQQAIQELSTPVLTVRDRMLLLPIIGVIDTRRARHLTQQLLQAIRANRAKVVVMDITGVPAVDSKVANHLLQTVAAARLMGATVVVTGLSADVAQALVTLGVDLQGMNTVGDLQGGLEEAEHVLGYRRAQAGNGAGGEGDGGGRGNDGRAVPMLED